MEFIDLKAQYHALQAKIDENIRQVLQSGKFIMGPEVYALEERLADYVGVKHCITVANGTDALLIAMMALGIGPGDEVITSPFSFIATAEMAVLLGAKPVYVDIDPNTYNLDPSLLEAAITPKTKLILPVDIYGQCADYDPINAIANRYGLPVVEDAAQSFGATYKGRLACGFGKIACTSFYPSKPLGCYGDGGACFTNDDHLANLIRQIRNHGQESSYRHVVLGMNSRLDSIQAAVLLAKLEVFPDELKRRNKIAAKFDGLLCEYVTVPYVEPHNSSVYAQYTIQVNDRDEVRQRLQERHIPTAVHYPMPIHKQPVMTSSTGNIALPISEEISARVVSLPFHPYLTEDEIEAIAQAVSEAIAVV